MPKPLKNNTIPEPVLTAVQELKLRKENEDIRRQLKEALESRVLDADYESFVTQALATPIKQPAWSFKPTGNRHEVMPVTNFSDWHLDEVVRPEEIQHRNAYNREIAEKRLKVYFSNVCKVARTYMQGFNYPGIVVNFLGDNFSGFIHEELRRTNEASMLESMIYWVGPVLAGIRMLADEFGCVWINGVVGNHGRYDKKPVMKKRAQENFDWMFMHMLKQHTDGDSRISWNISNGQKLLINIYDLKVMLSHGDECKGGSGIAGMLSPQLIAFSRMKKNGQFDQWWIGHWHNLAAYRGIRVNGCFPAGSLVTTESGRAAIETVKVGDRVLSGDGSIQTVTNLFQKNSEEGLTHLKVRGLPNPLSATPNHMVWAIKSETKSCPTIGTKWDVLVGNGDKPQWIPIDYLSPGDYVHIPIRDNLITDDTDEETAWMYGIYIAEGCAVLDAGKSKRQNRIDVTMHLNERLVLERWGRQFKKLFNKEGTIYLRPNKSTSAFICNGREPTILFRELFGHKSTGKHLPPFAHGMSEKSKRALLQGWVDGDGHTTPDVLATTHAKTASIELAYGAFDLALSAGQRPSMSTLKHGGPRLHDTHSIHFNGCQESKIVDGKLFYRIHGRYRDRQVVPVYDLEVSGAHTYVVNGVGVHNSGKGYDEYASVNNFDFQPPMQDFFLVAPNRGVIASWPIHCVADDEKIACKALKTTPFKA